MRLCTFEVATHVGRHSRVGAFRDGRIIDLNFATAWYLAQQDESEPQQLADALVPATMLEFLRAGLRAMHSAEDLFSDMGPRPPGWWKVERPPRGPNDETLVYSPDQVRLRAPLPNPARLGPDEDAPSPVRIEPELKFAAVIGRPGTKIAALEARAHIAGYTGMNEIGARHSALGPCLVTPDEIANPYALNVVARVDGRERARTTTASLRPKFEDTIATMSANDHLLPGDVIAFKLDVDARVSAGEVIELEIEKIGTLRTRVV